MDRKGQLANVAFGGAWSEQIAGEEALKQAMRHIEKAAGDSRHRDLCADVQTGAALQLLCAAHPKGAMMAAAWEKALGITDPALRVADLTRIALMIRSGIGGRLSG